MPRSPSPLPILGPGPAGPVADELDLGPQVDAVALPNRGMDVVDQASHIGRGRALFGDDEVGVLLGDARAAHAEALQAGRIDSLPGGWPLVGIPECAAGRGQAQ